MWTDRMSAAQWGDRIPHVAERSDGTGYWVVDGLPIDLRGVASAAAAMSDRLEAPERWENVPKAAYDPTARLAAMDADGIDRSVLYPTVAGLAGETFGRISNPELELACVRAYNDWLIDEWASVSARFIPQCIVPLFPVSATVAEIRRSVEKGHRAVVFPSIPMHLRDVPHLNEPEYDPVWAACQELEVPLCMHAGASTKVQFPLHQDLRPALADALRAVTGPVSTVFGLTNLLLSRILTRFPHLNVIFAESALGWSAFYLEYADHQFEQDHITEEGYELKPSELFKRQCFFTGWYDDVAASARFVGADHILWSTNFPLASSTWPESQQTIARSFVGVTPEARERILWRNAAKLYHVGA
ncbi:MAG: Amidohydro-rel protein [Chloroflexi bacterium]|nr:Amidohydro-rel protein [Chloroflexota bacterium]